MTNQKRLGRGLEALLGTPAPVARGEAAAQAPATTAPPATSTGEGLLKLSVHEIDANPFQPRREFDESEIAALCASLKEHGLIQPILVRRANDRYQLIAGERRLRAAIQAGWSHLPAQVKQVEDREVAEIAIVENLQRKDLNALEKAASFQQYLETYDCTQEELAQRLKIDRSTVANLIRLLELPDEVQDAVRRGAITQGHARALLPLGDEPDQIAFANRIQAEGLSVRATESLVQETIRQADAEPLALIGADGQVSRATTRRSDQLAALEQELRSALGTKVELKHANNGRGKIIIHFGSHEEFERLQGMFSPTPTRSQAG